MCPKAKQNTLLHEECRDIVSKFEIWYKVTNEINFHFQTFKLFFFEYQSIEPFVETRIYFLELEDSQ